MATNIVGVDGCDLRALVPDSNFDGGGHSPPPAHNCGMETKEYESSPLHHFDFSEIDSGDIITASSLFFYVSAVFESFGLNCEDFAFSIRRCRKDAYVSDPDYDDWITDEATWNIAHNGTPYNWGTAGCHHATEDRYASHAEFYFGPSGADLPKWLEIDVLDMTNDAHAEDQILNVLNCGYFSLVGAEDQLYYRYSSYTTGSNPPYLSITHEPGEPPPAFTPRVMIF